jgi:DNA invertase Pin-like site-specific DNA recombinase
MEKLGYARVSTVGQSLDAQLQQLREYGCTRVFQEKISGANLTDRNWLRPSLRSNRGIL